MLWSTAPRPERHDRPNLAISGPYSARSALDGKFLRRPVRWRGLPRNLPRSWPSVAPGRPGKWEAAVSRR